MKVLTAEGKGIDTLIKAFAHIGRDFPEARLVLAGVNTEYSSTIQSLINTLSNEQKERIILIDDFDEKKKNEVRSTPVVSVGNRRLYDREKGLSLGTQGYGQTKAC